MQEIAAAVREGAQAYLRRQYLTIAIVGIVIFAVLYYFLGLRVSIGFAVGAVLSTVMELVELLPVLTAAALFWSVPLAEPVKLKVPVPPVALQV